ncbi:MAG: hypothetical protein JWO11_183 [Nocardioides sp.]|nr:hypothetical protein [Nocardioides sp.]
MPFQGGAIGGSSAYALYGNANPNGTLAANFLRQGGLQLSTYPNEAGETLASALVDQLGDRAVRVQVGSFEGAITWGDPDADGLRPHYLSWTDDSNQNYVLTGLMSAEKLLAIGRGTVC